MSNSLKHWTSLLASRRRIMRGLRSRVIAHHKKGEQAARLVRAYERWKALVVQAQRGISRAKRARTKIVMYDDTNLSLVPANVKYLGVYVDGKYANAGTAARLFPNARLLPITVLGGYAVAGDIELGDMTPSSGAAWAGRMLDKGIKRPVCYANRSTMPAVITQLRKRGITRDQVRIWTADYTGHPHLPTFMWGDKLITSDACQWTDRSHSRSLDESICVPSFFD